MPSNVRNFFWLNCSSLLLGLIIAAFIDPKLAVEGKAVGGLSYVITIQVIVYAVMLFLLWLIAFKRKNWARWVWLALFLLGSPAYIAIFKNIFGITVQGGISLLQVSLQIIALYLIFTGNAVQWFRSTAEPGSV
jgi:hypothetical protein